MIDYKHPIIAEMKGKYRESREAYELADYHRGIGLEDARQLFEDAHTKLAGAETAVSGLMDSMRVADDVTPYEREYYLPFMNSHLDNIGVWLREVRRRLEGTKV